MVLTTHARSAVNAVQAVRRILLKNWLALLVALVLLLVVFSRVRTAGAIEKNLLTNEGIKITVDDPNDFPDIAERRQKHVAEETNVGVEFNPFEQAKSIPQSEPEPDVPAELTCPAPPFTLLAGKGAVIQLASFPGSGNTWIRHLIQRGSGALTGSVYNDKSLYLEFPAESVRNASVIAVKTHYPCEACWNIGPEKKTPAREAQTGIVRDYRATIQVLRSPFGAILSDFNHKLSGANHTGLASQEDFESNVFDDFVELRMKIWTRHATFYLHSKSPNDDNIWYDMKGRPVLLVYYEDLKKDTPTEMTKIFKFIKRYSFRDPFIAKMNALAAGKCSVAQDAVGGFKRSKPKTEPFSKVMPNGKTARAMVCAYVKERCNAFWKKDDPEWACS